MVSPGLTFSVATSPEVEEPGSPVTFTLVKVQPAGTISSKLKLEPAAGRLVNVNVLLLPVPPAVVMLTGLGTAGVPWPWSVPAVSKVNVPLPPIVFFTIWTVAFLVSVSLPSIVSPGLTFSVATSPATDDWASPVTVRLVKVQPAGTISSKLRLEPAAGRLVNVNVLLLPVPPAVVMLTGWGTAGVPWPFKAPDVSKVYLPFPPILFVTLWIVAFPARRSSELIVSPGLTFSVATSPATDDWASPVTVRLVKVQPAGTISSKLKLEPAAGR